MKCLAAPRVGICTRRLTVARPGTARAIPTPVVRQVLARADAMLVSKSTRQVPSRAPGETIPGGPTTRLCPACARRACRGRRRCLGGAVGRATPGRALAAVKTGARLAHSRSSSQSAAARLCQRLAAARVMPRRPPVTARRGWTREGRWGAGKASRPGSPEAVKDPRSGCCLGPCKACMSHGRTSKTKEGGHCWALPPERLRAHASQQGPAVDSVGAAMMVRRRPSASAWSERRTGCPASLPLAQLLGCTAGSLQQSPSPWSTTVRG